MSTLALVPSPDRTLDRISTELADAHQQAATALRHSPTHARRAGELLLEAKRQLQHGEWLPWLKACPFSERTAQVYMRIAERWSELPASEDLTIRDARRVLSAPKSKANPDTDLEPEPEEQPEPEPTGQGLTDVERRLLDAVRAYAIERASLETPWFEDGDGKQHKTKRAIFKVDVSAEWETDPDLPEERETLRTFDPPREVLIRLGLVEHDDFTSDRFGSKVERVPRNAVQL